MDIRPTHGQHWARRAHPDRLRATYRRPAGTEQFLGFYDIHQGCVAGTIHKRKTVRDLLVALRRLRRAYSRRKRVYVIMDNLPLHKTEVFSRYFSKNKIVPAWTPTYSSWLNMIECHFAAMKKFTRAHWDDPDHQARRRRIYRYLRWRNRRAGSNNCQLVKVCIY